MAYKINTEEELREALETARAKHPYFKLARHTYVAEWDERGIPTCGCALTLLALDAIKAEPPDMTVFAEPMTNVLVRILYEVEKLMVRIAQIDAETGFDAPPDVEVIGGFGGVAGDFARAQGLV